MGTRHVTVVKLDGKVKVAQYGQWDGYLSGQGKQIADFIERVKLDKFKERVQSLKPISSKDLKQKWVEAGADPKSDSVSFDVADKFKGRYPEFSRDTGAVVLDLIYAGQVDQVQLDKSYKSKDSWLEYVYIMDLDKQTLEIYTGHVCKDNFFKKLKFSETTTDKMLSLEKELNGDEE
jgi:hypothetical protein